MTPVSPHAPSGATQDAPSVDAIVLAAMPGIERSLRSGGRPHPERDSARDLERAAGAWAEALVAFSATPGIFAALAIGALLWGAMYRLMIG